MAQKDIERMMSELTSVLASGVETPQLSAYYAATETLKTEQRSYHTTWSFFRNSPNNAILDLAQRQHRQALRRVEEARERVDAALLALLEIAVRTAVLCRRIASLATRQSAVAGTLLAFATPPLRFDMLAELARREGWRASAP